MAFDGITIANIVTELNQTITGGKINKIAQPENDELIITIKNQRKQYRLFLSASASLPLIYLTETNKPSPLTAPNFCMLLRKHIGSGKIIAIEQPGMERIIRFTIEHLNELGDLCTKYLIVEIMGKHSNIIFCNEEDQIIDSIKHVSAHMSSVREVLPGRPYFIPETQSKLNPFVLTEEIFQEKIFPRPVNVAKAIYTSITGISPLMAEEVCYRAGIDGGIPTDGLEDVEPLYDKDTFVYFDRYSDGDPYDDIEYREHFRLILVAIKERRIVRIVYKGRKGKRIHTLIPKGLEYSSKDDKFRLVAESLKGTQYIINMQKITKCQVMEGFEKDSVRKRKLAFGEVILRLKDYRKALERAMLSFSDLEKETIKLDNDTYQIKLKYCVDDETEILIRILAFGPLIEVMGPDDFRDKIKERLLRQRKL